MDTTRDTSPQHPYPPTINASPRVRGSRGPLALAGILLLTVLVILGYFATIVLRSQTTTLRACHMQAQQLPRGVTTPADARKVDRTFGHPGNLDFLLAGQQLSIAGSSALAPLVMAGATTMDQVNRTHITVSATSSGEGMQALLAGQVDIAMSDVFAAQLPTPPSTTLYDYLLAVVPFTLVVSADIEGTIWNLTTSQVRGIFSGTITNWQAVGGPNEPIIAVNRLAGSGTRLTFERYVMGGERIAAGQAPIDTTSEVLRNLAAHRGAISYVATSGFITLPPEEARLVSPICLDGFGATTTNIADGDYPFWNIEHLYTIKAFTDERTLPPQFLGFLCGGDFQAKDVLTYGFLHATQLSDAAYATHLPPASPADIVRPCPD